MSKIVVKIKNNNFKSAHVVIINDGKVLILRRSATDQWMPGHYGLPGGKIDGSETPAEAISRECKEEAGLNVKPEDLIFLSKVSKEKQHAFYCTKNFSGEPKLDFEHDDFKWINPKDLSNYKIIPDLPSIIACAFENLK